MRALKDILYRAHLVEVIGQRDQEISSIAFDSRKVKENSLFIAIKGVQADGHDFIEQAIAKGASVIICEEIPEKLIPNTTYIKVNNSAHALGVVADNFYDNPSEKMSLVGVTGTNGKTTVATLLHRLFLNLGNKAGLLSTVENKIAEETVAATHTTPDPIQINQLLVKMLEAGCKYCFMEASSHAVVQERVAGLHFTGGIFTNISHDHLDYHKTFDEYIKAKKKFFDDLSSEAFALTNADEKQGKVMLQNTKASRYSYALKTVADFKGKILENSFDGLVLQLDEEEFHSHLIGEFNAYNLLAVYAAASLLGIEKMDALRILSNITSAEGRFECIRSAKDNIIGVVDYAHTPDALEKVLSTLKKIADKGERIITVIGCGGDRDRSKRPEMARVAATFSNKIIFTSDNPRSEDPEAIIDEMLKGLEPEDKSKVIAISNRREAIKAACTFAEPGDVVLVAGKGHEKYQEIKGERFPFDDKKELKEAFEMLDK